MSKIFISHSSQDNAKALAVGQWLEQQGWADYFLDIDPKPIGGLLPGERWQAALKTAADRCEVVVFLISPAWRDSKWCLAEFLQAKQLGKPVFGVMIESTPLESLPKEMTAEWQLCDLVMGEERQRFHVVQDQIVPPTDISLAGAGLAKLKQGLQKTGLDPSFFLWPPPSDPTRLPYRGLKALEAEDAAVFFGREAPLIRALDTLRRMVESGEQFFVMLGASGAGKSSFLRAGLWPRLKRDDRHFLPLPVIRPERAAITGQSGLVASLECTLREQKVPKTRAEIRTVLAKPEGIVNLLVEVQSNAQQRLGTGTAAPTILIGLDQAEELFGKEGTDEAKQFLDLLSRLLSQAARDQSSVSTSMLRVMILAAIRSDSYERLQTASDLAGIRQTPFSLPPLARGEYKMVIEGPAALHYPTPARKLKIEATLTEQLVNDAEGADALPLLAFILERLLIDHGADGDLRLDEYEKLGGLKGAIEAAVSKAWDNPGQEPAIPADEATRRALLYQVFPKLVMIDHDGVKAKRRVATWTELPPKTYPLLERLVAARLLLKDRRKLVHGQEAVDVVEVAHEALIHQWRWLQEWLNEDREFLLWRERLKGRVSEWQHNKNTEDVGLLLQGASLVEAQRWLVEKTGMLTDQEQDFITRSAAAYDQAMQAEQRRVKNELAQAKRLAEEAAKREKAERERAVSSEEARKAQQELHRLKLHEAERAAQLEKQKAEYELAQAKGLAEEAAKRGEAERARAAAAERAKRRQRYFSLTLVILLGGAAINNWLWRTGYNLDQAVLKVQSLFASIHVPPQMVQIQGGTFQMGDVEKLGEEWRNPPHAVIIKSFAMGKFEVTFTEFDRFAIATGSRLPEDQGWGRGHRPVINVSWDDARAYVEWLSEQTGKRYRLPTESEWEYAARSGAKQEVWAGTSDDSQLADYAVFQKNSSNSTAEVGTKKANGFGLHDLSGNVFEWVEDCWHDTYKEPPLDGSAWVETDEKICKGHVIRGGSWYFDPQALRASARGNSPVGNRGSSLGFRLAQDIP